MNIIFQSTNLFQVFTIIAEKLMKKIGKIPISRKLINILKKKQPQKALRFLKMPENNSMNIYIYQRLLNQKLI